MCSSQTSRSCASHFTSRRCWQRFGAGSDRGNEYPALMGPFSSEILFLPAVGPKCTTLRLEGALKKLASALYSERNV